jgi:hypothetical protein
METDVTKTHMSRIDTRLHVRYGSDKMYINEVVRVFLFGCSEIEPAKYDMLWGRTGTNEQRQKLFIIVVTKSCVILLMVNCYYGHIGA